MKSIKKKIIASALAVTLLGGAFMPKAKAEGATEKQIWKDLKITKILNKVEKGVTTPDAEFEFSFTPKTEGAPKIENVKIGYTAADNTDADTKDGIQVEKTVGVDLSKIPWTESGIYEYELEEVIPNAGIKDMDYGYLLSYKNRYLKPGQRDYTPYKITFKVEEIDGKLEVTGITVFNRDGKFSGKLEYDDEKSLKFKNFYDKKDGNDNPGGGTDITDDDKKGFAFKKIVDSKNQADLDKSFDFDLKVEKAVGSNSKDKEFKYVVVDKDGNVGGEQTAAYGTEFTVNLKDKERVVFTDVILGSKVSVTEKDSKGLTPSIESNFFEKDASSNDKTTVVGYIGDQESGNYAEFTNKNAPITGILIDNLPYIALVVVAGFGIFFFVKNRKEEEIYA